MSKHVHELAAAYMMGVLDYDTLKVGCHECGQQWVVTINWADRTLQISWVNVAWNVYFDSDRSTVTIDQVAQPDADEASRS